MDPLAYARAVDVARAQRSVSRRMHGAADTAERARPITHVAPDDGQPTTQESRAFRAYQEGRFVQLDGDCTAWVATVLLRSISF